MSEAFAWGVWENLGSPSVGIVGQERLAVAANLDGHLELFAVGSDGAVWHTWQTAPNGPWAGWWASFGQPSGVSFAVPSSSRIQVEQNADGRLEVFLMGNDNNMWHTWQVAPNVNWIGQWASLGRPDVNIQPVGGFLTSLVREAGGELEIFIENTDTGEVWSRWQNEPNGGWLDGWSSLSMPRLPFVPTIRSFSVVENTNGQREVLAIGSDGAIWHNAILEMTAHTVGLDGVW